MGLSRQYDVKLIAGKQHRVACVCNSLKWYEGKFIQSKSVVCICYRSLESQNLSILTAIFPHGLGLPGTRTSPFWILLDQMVMEVVVTTGAIRRAKLQSNRHHQQTNTQCFTCRMPFLSPNQQCQSTEGKTGEKNNQEILLGKVDKLCYLCDMLDAGG